MFPHLFQLGVGFFGISHVKKINQKHYNKYNIQVHKLSAKPTKIPKIINQKVVEKTIENIQNKNLELDCIVILLGDNDIGAEHPKYIFKNIIKISETFEDKNYQTIIVPILNRKKPKKISTKQYKTNRNYINKQLRKYYKQKKINKILKIRDLALGKDGVHLKESSYKILAKSIKFHLENIAPKKLLKLPPNTYTDEKTKEEWIIENITEETST